MRLPSTSAASTFRISAGRRNVLFNPGTYATTATGSTLQVLSVINEAGKQDAVIQSTASAQPTWSGTAMSAPFLLAGSGTGSTNALSASPAFIFAPTQYFEYDTLASQYAGAELPVTMVAAVNPSSAGGTIMGFGDASTDVLKLSYSGGNIVLTETNSNGTFNSATDAVVAGTTCIVTGIRANGILTLRVNGAKIATQAVTAGTEPFTTFCVGALNTAGSVSLGFTGQIGEVLVYSGNADVYSVESELLLKYGVIRGLTSGTNSGF